MQESAEQSDNRAVVGSLVPGVRCWFQLKCALSSRTRGIAMVCRFGVLGCKLLLRGNVCHRCRTGVESRYCGGPRDIWR